MPHKAMILIGSWYRCLHESTHILSLEPNVILVKMYTVVQNDKDCCDGDAHNDKLRDIVTEEGI